MSFLQSGSLTPETLLALITLAPVLAAWALGWFSSPPEKAGAIRMGNPLRAPAGVVFEHEVVRDPLLHLSRTERPDDLRALALGLRNSPVGEAAPLLKHFMQSTDPELALFSQSTLQQGRERLQATLGRLQNHPDRDDPRIAAALLETSLQLVAPSLAAPGERDGRLQQLATKAVEILGACTHTPRLAMICTRIFLAARDPAKAQALMQAMPADAALRHELEPTVRFALANHMLAAA